MRPKINLCHGTACWLAVASGEQHFVKQEDMMTWCMSDAEAMADPGYFPRFL